MKLYFILFTIILTIGHSFAQKPFEINAKGEISKSNYEKLLKSKSYDAVSNFDTVNKNPLLIYAIYVKNGKLGILDHKGKEITEAKYDRIWGLQKDPVMGVNYYPDFYIVQIHDKAGVISNTGKEIIPMIYHYISFGERLYKKYEKVSYFIAKTESGDKFFNTKGMEIPKPAETKEVVSHVSENLPILKAKTYTDENPYGKVIRKSGKFGVVEAKIDEKYQQGVVNLETKKVLIPIEYGYVVIDRFQRFIAGNYKSENFALYDTIGVALKKDFQKIEEINGIYFFTKDSKIAYFDQNLKQLSDFEYEEYAFYSNNRIMTYKGGKKGMIDLSGKIIIPFEYDNLNFITYQVGSKLDHNPFVRATKERKEGLLDFDGKILIPVEFDQLDTQIAARDKERRYSGSGEMMPLDHTITENNQYFVVQKNGKYGLYGKDYSILLPVEFSQILKADKEEFVHVVQTDQLKNKSEGLFNVLKKEFLFDIKPLADYTFKNGRFILSKKEGKFGLYDLEAKQIIPYQEMEISGFHNLFNGLIQFYSYKPQKAVLYIGQHGISSNFIEVSSY
jgi:hypothetical protein